MHEHILRFNYRIGGHFEEHCNSYECAHKMWNTVLREFHGQLSHATWTRNGIEQRNWVRPAPCFDAAAHAGQWRPPMEARELQPEEIA